MIIFEREEGDLAVLETDQGIRTVSRNLLPASILPGTVLVPTEDGRFQEDLPATEARRQAVTDRFRRLRRSEGLRF